MQNLPGGPAQQRGPGKLLGPPPTGDANTGSAAAAGLLQVDVSVEYMAGCQRSHAARLAVPVSLPFRCAPAASRNH